jgi:hypothetical protein
VVTNALLVQSCDLLDLNAKGETQGTLGLFQYRNPLGDSNECTTISDIANRDIQDAAFKCARVTSLMAFGFGGILLVFGFFKQCLFPLPCTHLLMDLAATGVQICLALVYVIWMSEACDMYQCVYGNGATYLVATQGLWLIVGCFSRCMRDGRSERRRGEQ